MSVKDARTMQQEKGFFSTSLYYHGSTEKYHYFTQIQHEDLIWCILMWRNSLLTSKELCFKIPFYELYDK